MDSMGVVDIAARFGTAVGLGSLVGMERGYQQHNAGLRTHALIALAAALFTVVSAEGFAGGDPSRVGAQIVSGIGFLGAGTILQLKAGTRGLTTAASVWAAAGLGMAAGTGLYTVGLVAGVFAVGILVFMRPLARLIGSLAVGDETTPNFSFFRRSRSKPGS